jgi:predicted PhzF superfamily epimerase YddE/YHI9
MTEPRTLPLYQIDAFAAQPFSGNPAAVCPLDRWLPDPLMQQIAAENNLAETAFSVPAKGVPEDAVTGSAHCQIVPYWCARLGRADLKAFQASSRGGFLHCSYDGGAYVVQRGYCIPYLEGSIRI